MRADAHLCACLIRCQQQAAARDVWAAVVPTNQDKCWRFAGLSCLRPFPARGIRVPPAPPAWSPGSPRRGVREGRVASLGAILAPMGPGPGGWSGIGVIGDVLVSPVPSKFCYPYREPALLYQTAWGIGPLAPMCAAAALLQIPLAPTQCRAAGLPPSLRSPVQRMCGIWPAHTQGAGAARRRTGRIPGV